MCLPRQIRLLPLLLVLLLLLASGLLVQPAEVVPHQDKLHHLLGFAAFAVSLRMARPALQLWKVLLFAMAAAALIESGQALLPGRTASIADVGAGLIGAGSGWFCAEWVQGWLARRKAEAP